MGEQANTVPPKGFGNVDLTDVLKSIGLAVAANVGLSVYSIIDSGSWPTNEDWADILRTTVAFILSYILKNLLTNNVGQLFKKDQPVVTVDAKKLDEVVEEANEPKGQA